MNTSIELDANGNIVVTSPDFSTDPNVNPSDEINKWLEDYPEISEDSLESNGVIDSIEYVDGTTDYYYTDRGGNKVPITEEEYYEKIQDMNNDISEPDTDNTITEFNKSGVDGNVEYYENNSIDLERVSIPTADGYIIVEEPTINKHDKVEAVHNPGHIEIKLNFSMSELSDFMNASYSVDDIEKFINDSTLTIEEKDALKNWLDATYVGETVTGINFIKDLNSALDEMELYGKITSATRASIASVFVKPLANILGLDNSFTTDSEFINAVDKNSGAIVLALSIAAAVTPVGEAALIVASMVVTIVSLIIDSPADSGVDFQHNIDDNGKGLGSFTFESNGVTISKQIDIDLENVKQTVEQLILYAETSRLNMTMALNGLALKNNHNIMVAQNSLHNEIITELEGYDMKSSIKSIDYAEGAIGKKQIGSLDALYNELKTRDFIHKIKYMYGLSTEYDMISYDIESIKKPDDPEQELKRMYDCYLSNTSITSIGVLVYKEVYVDKDTSSQMNSNYDSIMNGTYFFESGEMYLGRIDCDKADTDNDYVEIYAKNLKNFYTSKLQEEQYINNVRNYVKNYADTPKVKCSGALWWQEFDSYMSSKDNKASVDGFISKSLKSIDNLFELLYDGLTKIDLGSQELSERDKEIAGLVGNWEDTEVK